MSGEFVRIKEQKRNLGYLTIGKLYEVITWDERVAFTILDDDGDEIFCLVNGDGHLGWGSWEIVPESNKCENCGEWCNMNAAYGDGEWCENCVPY